MQNFKIAIIPLPTFKQKVVAILATQVIIALSLLIMYAETLSYMVDSRLFPYAVVMEVTAYTAGPESTGRHLSHPDYGVTASTYRLNVGNGEKCIAAPPEIAFGTRIYVPGYGMGIVKDRGEDIRGNRLDIYYDDVSTAKNWGRRQLKIIVFP